MTDAELHRRGCATLLASWEAYAHGLPDAALVRAPGVAAAVFPAGPERDVYNNALLARAEGIAPMEAAYAAAGVERFAAWVHESDGALRATLERRGYTLDTATRAMAMALDDLPLPRPALDAGDGDLRATMALFGLPEDLLAHADPAAFRVLIARDDAGVPAASALAFDHDGDCGIFNVGTLERCRRRGLATALTARQLHDAVARGCTTASLQATPMAEGVYAAAGFRDLGRFLELVPPAGGQPPRASSL